MTDLPIASLLDPQSYRLLFSSIQGAGFARLVDLFDESSFCVERGLRVKFTRGSAPTAFHTETYNRMYRKKHNPVHPATLWHSTTNYFQLSLRQNLTSLSSIRLT